MVADVRCLCATAEVVRSASFPFSGGRCEIVLLCSRELLEKGVVGVFYNWKGDGSELVNWFRLEAPRANILDVFLRLNARNRFFWFFRIGQ